MASRLEITPEGLFIRQQQEQQRAEIRASQEQAERINEERREELARLFWQEVELQQVAAGLSPKEEVEWPITQ